MPASGARRQQRFGTFTLVRLLESLLGGTHLERLARSKTIGKSCLEEVSGGQTLGDTHSRKLTWENSLEEIRHANEAVTSLCVLIVSNERRHLHITSEVVSKWNATRAAAVQKSGPSRVR